MPRNRTKYSAARDLWLNGKTYVEIAVEMGLSRQRIQQMLRPPAAIFRIVYDRANGQCENCGMFLTHGGHIHHIALRDGDFNDVDNLQYLCVGCHRHAHATVETITPRTEPINMHSSELVARRHRMGITQAQLAEALGVAANTVARWERGERTIPPLLRFALQVIDEDIVATPPTHHP